MMSNNTRDGAPSEPFKGTAWVVGDDVSTDEIISGKYLELRDIDELSTHVLETRLPGFAASVQKGDVIIAGENFGSGSSREQAPLLLRHAGISMVAAKSFARIFFRNAMNLGLPAFVLEGDVSIPVRTGDPVTCSISPPSIYLEQVGKKIDLRPLPPFFIHILQAGGAIPLLRDELGLERQ